MVVLVVFLRLQQQPGPPAKMVVLVVVLPIILPLTILILVVQVREQHGQEHQEMTPDQDGVAMVADQTRQLLLMEAVAVAVPKMVDMEAEVPVVAVVVHIKFLLHIPILMQLMDMLDLAVHTSGSLVAAEVEPMTVLLVLRV